MDFEFSSNYFANLKSIRKLPAIFCIFFNIFLFVNIIHII